MQFPVFLPNLVGHVLQSFVCLSFVASWDASLFPPQVLLALSLYQALCLACSTISAVLRVLRLQSTTHGLTDLWCLQVVNVLNETFNEHPRQPERKAANKPFLL